MTNTPARNRISGSRLYASKTGARPLLAIFLQSILHAGALEKFLSTFLFASFV